MSRFAEQEYAPTSRARAVAQVAATALAYYAAARLTLLLEGAPDSGPAVWPAAGVALAAVLISGSRAAFGVLLAVFALHLRRHFDATGAALSFDSLAPAISVPLLIGAGAAVQALAAAFLVRQFADWPRSLTGESNVLRFLLLAGPASCLVGPTIGVGSLVLFGALQTPEIPVTWGTWWVRDTIGTTLFAPLILIWCARRPPMRLQRRVLVTVPMALACTVALGFYVVSAAREHERARAEFGRRADDLAHRIARDSEENLDALASLASFLDASREIEEQEFASFARELLRRYHAVQALSWSPLVPAQGGGVPAQGGGVPAPGGGESAQASYRVTYVEPAEAPVRAVGFDLASDPEIRAALARARESGKAAATAPMELQRGGRSVPAMFVFRPVFAPMGEDRGGGDGAGEDGGNERASAQSAEVRGYAAAVLRLDGVFETALSGADLDGISFVLRDVTTAGAGAVLFERSPDERASSGDRGASAAVAPTTVARTLAGRQWEMRFRLSPASLVAHRSWQVWSVSAGSLLFASLLGAFLLVMTGRTETVEQVVAGRTRELEQANFRLRHQIAERIRAEEQHRESESRFEAAQQVAHLGSWEWDVATGAMSWSDELYRVYGLAPGTVKMEHGEFLSRAHPDDRAMVERTLEQAVRDRKPFDFYYRIQRPDGSVRILRSLGEIGSDASGKTARMHGTGQDVTELKEAEKELAQRSEELERSNAELERFAYVASHDLQEPLRAVASHVQILQQDYLGKLDDEADECIRAAVEGAQRMHDLINDYLAYSRLDTETESHAATSSATALSVALMNLERAIRVSRAKITNDPLPDVMADATQVVQLFQNLIANAVKFRRDEPPRVHICAAKADRSWLFSVRDNGIGIDPEHTGRIFSLFQRLHTQDRYPGTGIGLAICKKVVEGHGGRIWVESMPGMGATFWFTLPGVSAHDPQRDPARRSSPRLLTPSEGAA